MGEEQ
jgi:hypothetical protein